MPYQPQTPPLPTPPRRGVLSLDDDILVPCTTVEAAFATWRASPGQLVGFYPRLLLPAGGKGAPGPPVYAWEERVFRQVRLLCAWVCSGVGGGDEGGDPPCRPPSLLPRRSPRAG